MRYGLQESVFAPAGSPELFPQRFLKDPRTDSVWIGMNRIFVSLVAIAATAGLWHGARKGDAGPRASGAMGSAFYVWQRSWDGAVKEAVRTVPETVGGLAPLCAEIAWSEGQPRVAWPDLDMAALRSAGRPVSAVLRVGPRVPSELMNAEVCRVALEVLQRLRAGQVEPVELQIDFDCADSQLAGYRATLAGLRSAVTPMPVRPTVLPGWLARGEFAKLARECGAYVLQVHATAVPRIDSAETALCETEDARRWVERAGKIGVPFRVALPTYAYRVAFAPDGRLLGIEAEGKPRAWPEGTVMRAFRPDAAKLAALIGDWNRDRPACLTGLLWYRLPVSTDVQNWRWPTLSAVMQARAPRPDLRVEKSGTSPVDLAVFNDGEAEMALPARIVATGAVAVDAADGVGGYRAEIAGATVVFLRDEALAQARIPPGARHAVGWLRAGTEIQIQTQQP